MIVYVLLVCAAVAVLAVGGWMIARRRSPATTGVDQPSVDAEPMTGLEAALARAKDRTGRSIGERIEAEPVDDLRIPDDTGPLLRRALDHVTPAHADGEAPIAPPTEPSDEPD